MEVINDLLNYNGLKIVQNPEWFSFSLDSVLLASFVNVKKTTRIMDLCTGNAPIPLFLSMKTNEKIIGVELQREVFELARRSVDINHLNNKIVLINEDVRKIGDSYDTDCLDLITCNPPYFKYCKEKEVNSNNIKAIARHEICINLDDVFKVAKKLLKNNGKIAMVNRTDRLIDIITSMQKNNITPKRIKFVYSFKNSNSNIVLIEGSKNGRPGIKVEEPLIVHQEDNAYTKEIKGIFNGGVS